MAGSVAGLLTLIAAGTASGFDHFGFGDGSQTNNPMLTSHFSLTSPPVAPPVQVPVAPVPVAVAPPAQAPAMQTVSAPIYQAPMAPMPVSLAPYVVETSPAVVTQPQAMAPAEQPIQLENGHPAAWIAVPAPTQPIVPDEQNAAPDFLPAASYGGFDTLHPPANIDWSVGLRGSYATGNMKPQQSLVLTPDVTLTYGGDRMDLSANAGFEGVTSNLQLARVDQLHSGVDLAYALDRVTSASFSANLDVSQDDANAPGVPKSISVMPITYDGSVSAGVARQFGQLGLDLTGDLGRTQLTPTYLKNGTVEDNADLSFYSGGANLRASFQVTPIVAPFVELGAGRSIYDKAPQSTGMKLDQTNYSLRGGVAATWQDSFTLEASTGYTWANFDDPGLTDIGAQTYALSVDFAPPEGVTAGLGLSTTINPGDPDTGVVASVDYAIDGNVGVKLSSQFGMTANFAAGWTAPVSGLPGDFTYSTGLGASYQLNHYAAVTADYAYNAVDRAVGPLKYSHTISAGITVSRPE
ncbi:MAG: outer membrane beta-barrel protein [Hyphomicrobiaceae bacterium]|nr:outer membrane beta-barrel protein [Hyphomicrobiaceae bacterium]